MRQPWPRQSNNCFEDLSLRSPAKNLNPVAQIFFIAQTSLLRILALLTTQVNQELPDFRMQKPLKPPILIETTAQIVGMSPLKFERTRRNGALCWLAYLELTFSPLGPARRPFPFPTIPLAELDYQFFNFDFELQP
jgi:hypothetical protein